MLVIWWSYGLHYIASKMKEHFSNKLIRIAHDCEYKSHYLYNGVGLNWDNLIIFHLSSTQDLYYIGRKICVDVDRKKTFDSSEKDHIWSEKDNSFF